MGDISRVEVTLASRIEIKCINKTDRMNEHERIRNVGGTNADGRQWKQSQETTIQEIENGSWSFYVTRDALQPIALTMAAAGFVIEDIALAGDIGALAGKAKSKVASA